MSFTVEMILRCVLAIAAGALIGAERARHGRVAGMRTHILVCLGSALTAMTGVFVNMQSTMSGDPFRISAQVISGIGFLGAGMIILRHDHTITGLTTAAGVWATATIGIALGYGFYLGAACVTLLLLISIIFFARFEKRRKQHMYVYVEVLGVDKINGFVEKIENKYSSDITYRITPAKSGVPGNVGMEIDFKSATGDFLTELREFEEIVLAIDIHE